MSDQTKETKKSSPLKKTLKIVGNVAIWLFVAFAVVMTTLALAAQANADGVPAISGKCFLTVSTDSMAPTFRSGDMLICKMLVGSEKTDLEKGDVISFYADLDGNGTMEINTHRIYEVNRNADGVVINYTTKGDNEKTNLVADKDPVQCQNVICRWDGDIIPKVGGAIAFLQQPTGFLVAIVLPLVLLFFYQMFVFVKTVVSVKNSGKRQISAADEELIKQRAVEEYLRQKQEEEAAAKAAAEAAAAASEAPSEKDGASQ